MIKRVIRIEDLLRIKEIALFLICILFSAINSFSQQEDSFVTENRNFYRHSISFQYRASVNALTGFDMVVMTNYYSGFYFGANIRFDKGEYNSNGTTILDNLVDSLTPTGKYLVTRNNGGIGLIRRLHYNILFYGGLGYGTYHRFEIFDEYDEYNILSPEEEKVYVRNLKHWYGGLETCGGFIIDLNRITLNTGVTILNLKKESLRWTWGIGIVLNKQKAK